MVYLAAVIGKRWGECAGLKVGAIDFASNTVAIVSQLTRGHRGAIVDGAPKWQSHRTIAAPKAQMDMLSDHLRIRGLSAGDTDGYVFVAPDGRELHYSNWRQRVWVPAMTSVGLEGLTFHALRHANGDGCPQRRHQDGAGPSGAQARLNPPRHLRPGDHCRRPQGCRRPRPALLGRPRRRSSQDKRLVGLVGLVGLARIELATSALSVLRSNRLSYSPANR